MRLLHIVECDTVWSMRLIESSAGCALPHYYFPSGSKEGGAFVDGTNVLFSENGSPRWIGTFATKYELFFIQFNSDEIIFLSLGYESDLIQIFLSDPSIYHCDDLFHFGDKPNLQVLNGRIFFINESGFLEISLNNIKNLFYVYDDDIKGQIKIIDGNLLNVRMYSKDVFQLEIESVWAEYYTRRLYVFNSSTRKISELACLEEIEDRFQSGKK